MGRKHVVVAALAVLAVAGGLDAATARRASERASVWVDPTGGTCVRRPPQAYSDAAACGSLGAAHAIARSGDMILVKGGTYTAPQTISSDRGSIVIQNARGEVPDFTSVAGVNLDAPAANITLQGLSARVIFMGTNCSGSESSCGPRVRNISALNLDVKTFQMKYVDGVVWSSGDIGPADSCTGDQHPLIADAGDAGWAPKNIVVMRSYFHDIDAIGCGDHTECLLVWAADGVTIKGNRFRNCGSTGSLYITELNVPDYSSYCTRVTIENNWFLGRDNGTNDYVHFESDCDMIIRFNSFSRSARPFLLNAQGDSSNVNHTVDVYGNYGNQPAGLCATFGAHWIFRNNVWRSTKCHASDTPVSRLDFVNPESDLHLKARANAIDRSPSSLYPVNDMDGEWRYSGRAPDAGADEWIPRSAVQCGRRVSPPSVRRCD